MIFLSCKLAFGVSCVPSTGYIHDRYVMQMFNYLSRNLTIEFDCICTFPIQVKYVLTHVVHTLLLLHTDLFLLGTYLVSNRHTIT